MKKIKITIIKETKPRFDDLNNEIQWFSKSLGLFDSKRDKERSCFRIFIQLLKTEKPLSSDELAEKSNLSRGTVIYHIHNLVEKGIVKEERKRYALMFKNLHAIVEDMHKNIEETMDDLKDMAKKIDKSI